MRVEPNGEEACPMGASESDKLRRRIAELEAENTRLRRNAFPSSADRTVIVPEPFREVFARAQEPMGDRSLEVPTSFDRKRAQDTLRRSEESLRTLLDALPLPVFLVRSDDARCIYGNEHTVKMFGGGFLDNELPDLFVSDRDRDEVRAALATNRLANGRELRLRTASGEARWTWTSCVPMPLPAGEGAPLWARRR